MSQALPAAASSPASGKSIFSLQNSRALRWTVGVAAASMVGLSLVLLFLLTQATDSSRQLYERNIGWLLGLNIAAAVVLLGAIGWITVRLIIRFRQGRFGSRLLVKLAATFALVGFLPGMLVYLVSYNFVSHSIESWFDVKVDTALEASLNLGRVTLETLQNELGAKTRSAANQLADTPNLAAGLVLERLRDQLGARDVMLFGAASQTIAVAGQSQFQLNPERPSATQFREARGSRFVTWAENFEDARPESMDKARIKALVQVPNAGAAAFGESRYLLVSQALSSTLVANAIAVGEASSSYQERKVSRDGLKKMYLGTLTLSLFLGVFGAVLLAVLLGNQIARPLLLLADGVSQVAAGDLTPKAALQGKDELGGLTRAFADMTNQLADARRAVETSMEQVSAARANLQTILDNLTAGVIVLDAKGLIQTSNPGATRILRVPLAACEGRNLADIDGLQDFARNVQSHFSIFLSTHHEHGLDHWQQSFELGTTAPRLTPGPAGDAITLLARGAELPGANRLLVFDDISEIVSAQRVQAWGEVARRLAHEIKNPLTPIQLSAERLEIKLANKLEAPEAAVLAKSVKTIIDQVDAMKRLVNEFRDYARLPAAELKPLDLNQLVTEVLQLYGSGGDSVPLHLDLDARAPHIMGDSHQLRQVVHNLLQNAQDATESAARTGDTADRSVTVKTQWLDGAKRVRLSIIDNGTGFPDSILKRAFEPYVTTKAKGTGLGLAVVKKIADDHGTRVDIVNRVVDGELRGAQVSLSFAIDEARTA
jgi:nitrogen fixation/metabolism regulation signal transduction histidine kinase